MALKSGERDITQLDMLVADVYTFGEDKKYISKMFNLRSYIEQKGIHLDANSHWLTNNFKKKCLELKA